MKIFGRELKFNGFDIWHTGNFNPDNKADSVHTHIKSQIINMPTKLSEFTDDIGAGGGDNVMDIGGVPYRYNFTVDETTGGLVFIYEEV